MKRSTLIKLAVFLVIAVALGIWFLHELRVDSCLDRGGRWNNDLLTCEGATES